MSRDYGSSFELLRLFSDDERLSLQNLSDQAKGNDSSDNQTQKPSSASASSSRAAATTSADDDFDFDDDASSSFGSKPFVLSLPKKTANDAFDDDPDLDWDNDDDDDDDDDDDAAHQKNAKSKTNDHKKKKGDGFGDDDDDDDGFGDDDDFDLDSDSVIHLAPPLSSSPAPTPCITVSNSSSSASASGADSKKSHKKSNSDVDCFDDDFDFDDSPSSSSSLSSASSIFRSSSPSKTLSHSKSSSVDIVPAMRIPSVTSSNNSGADEDDCDFQSDFADEDDGGSVIEKPERSSRLGLSLQDGQTDIDLLLLSIQDGDVEAFEKQWQECETSHKISSVLNKTDSDERTLLWWAAYCNQTEILEKLLKAGASVHKADRFGVTPILATASCGFVSAGRLLLRFGASSYDHDNQQESVLYKSSKHGHLDFVRMLSNSNSINNNNNSSNSNSNGDGDANGSSSARSGLTNEGQKDSVGSTEGGGKTFEGVVLPSVINESPQWDCTALYLVESDGDESMASDGLDILEITNRDSADTKCYSQLQVVSLDGVIVSANIILSESKDVRRSVARRKTNTFTATGGELGSGSGSLKKDVEFHINKLIMSEKSSDNRDASHLIALCYAEITSQLALSEIIPTEWALEHAPELSFIRLPTREFESLFYSVDRNNLAFKTSCQRPLQLNVALLDPSLLLLSYRLDRISHARVLRIDYSASGPVGHNQIGSEATSLWSLKQQHSHHKLLHHYRLIGTLPLYRKLHDILTKTGYGRLSVLVRKVRNLSKEVKHYHFSLAISGDQRRTFSKKRSNLVWNIKYNFMLPARDMALNIVLFTKDKQHGERALGHALVSVKDLELDCTVARWYRLFADKGLIAEVLLDLYLEPS